MRRMDLTDLSSALVAVLASLMLTLTPGCGAKDGGGDGGDNPFAQRKAHIDAYMAAIEGAGEPAKAVEAGQAWLDANLDAYKANCTKLFEWRQDLKKSEGAEGHDTPFDDYFERALATAGQTPSAAPITVQFNSFFNCDNLMNPQ